MLFCPPRFLPLENTCAQSMLLRASLIQHDFVQRPKGSTSGWMGGRGGESFGRHAMADRMGFAAESRGVYEGRR
jgi:hypothetical protein